jgi:hypothetical protein
MQMFTSLTCGMSEFFFLGHALSLNMPLTVSSFHAMCNE